MTTPTITAARLGLYDELNEEGRAYVDRLAVQIDEQIRVKAIKHNPHSKPPSFGDVSSRELAIALMQHCWTGEVSE